MRERNPISPVVTASYYVKLLLIALAVGAIPLAYELWRMLW